jgi:KDO2-lipid IV(A) lauroyltransferase
MRESPADVFWLQDRWKIRRREPHRQPGKPSRSGDATPTKRRRALLWVEAGAGGAGGMPVPPKAVPDDVDYELGLAPEAVAPVGAMGDVHRCAVGEGYAAFLRRVDEAHAQPLEFVAGTSAASAVLYKACRSLGLGWVDAKAEAKEAAV